jgi:VanZ family protein
LDLWTTDSSKITTFNAFPHDPSARRLLEMMHFEFETQYTLKIQKPQDLEKFNKHLIDNGNIWGYYGILFGIQSRHIRLKFASANPYFVGGLLNMFVG